MIKVSRLRVGFQIFIHILIAVHLWLYYFQGQRSVGGLDFQDFFHSFLGEGVITYAVLFALIVYASSLIFGRLFCSWGCHFAAVQDGCAWILKRVGWKVPYVRTRFVHWLPYFFLLAIFILPNIPSWWSGGWTLRPISRETLAGAAPWQSLPGWMLSIVTLLVCGGFVLVFLGKRGFCRFVCPYGAVFRVTERVSPFRVRRTTDCVSGNGGSGSGDSGTCGGGCGERETPPCTTACPTAIDVHAETEHWGAVRSIDCVQCHLCIEACPSQALAYSASSAWKPKPAAVAAPGPGPVYTFGVRAELFAVVSTISIFLAIDGVYAGHFLAACMAFGLTAASLLGRHWLRRKELRLGVLRLRPAGWAGAAFFGACVVAWILVAQACFFQWHWRIGAEVLARHGAETSQSLEAAAGHLRSAAGHLRAARGILPRHIGAREALIECYQRLGNPLAVAEARDLVRLLPESRVAWEGLRQVLVQFGPAGEISWVEARIHELAGRN